jgi:hypothetical protein
MRVTDGSATDNPVAGVNVTFLTTLERIPQGPGVPPAGDNFQGPGTMPVILGSSQTQVTTGQDGAASITPTVGSLGPCDALFTVTAGNASAQFDLQALDPIQIIQSQPKKQSVARKQSPAHFAADDVPQQNVGTALFVIPQEIPQPEASPDPPTDASPTTEDSAIAGSRTTVTSAASSEKSPSTASSVEEHTCTPQAPADPRSAELPPQPSDKVPDASNSKAEPAPPSNKAALKVSTSWNSLRTENYFLTH